MTCMFLRKSTVWNTLHAVWVGQETLRLLCECRKWAGMSSLFVCCWSIYQWKDSFQLFRTSFYRWQRWCVTLTVLFQASYYCKETCSFLKTDYFLLSTDKNYIFTGFMLWSLNAITIKTWHMPLVNYFHQGTLATSYSLILHLCLKPSPMRNTPAF